MVLLLVVFLFALCFGLVVALLRLSLQRMQKQAAAQLAAHFDDADTIIRSGRAPASWVSTYRQQLDKMRNAGKSDRAIQRVGVRAQKACLRQLNFLVNFLENGRFYDSLETREMMVDALRAVHEQWSTSSWEELLASPPGK
jgi:hypothetical protein